MPKRAGLRDIPSLDITLATPLEGVKRLKGTGTFDTKRQRISFNVSFLDGGGESVKVRGAGARGNRCLFAVKYDDASQWRAEGESGDAFIRAFTETAEAQARDTFAAFGTRGHPQPRALPGAAPPQAEREPGRQGGHVGPSALHLRLLRRWPVGQDTAALQPCCLQSLSFALHNAEPGPAENGVQPQSFLRVPQLRRPPVRFPKLPCKMRNGSCEHCEVPARRPCSRGNDCGDVAHGVLGEPEGGRVLRCVRGGRRAAPRGALLAGAHHPGHDDRRRRLRVCW